MKELNFATCEDVFEKINKLSEKVLDKIDEIEKSNPNSPEMSDLLNLEYNIQMELMYFEEKDLSKAVNQYNSVREDFDAVMGEVE